MHIEPEPAPGDVYTALWVGALLIAGGTVIDAFSVELDELTERFFAQFRPIAKA